MKQAIEEGFIFRCTLKLYNFIEVIMKEKSTEDNHYLIQKSSKETKKFCRKNPSTNSNKS